MRTFDCDLQENFYDIVGPVCESGDFLGKNRKLSFVKTVCKEKLKPDDPNEISVQGELLAIWDTGAYCSSMASNYNMRGRPLEILVNRSEWKIIRKRETFEDLFSLYDI